MNITLKFVDSIGKFWQIKFLSVVFRYNLTALIIQIILIVIRYQELPSKVPLYYSLPWGESQLASVETLFLIPVISLVVLITNNIISAVNFNQESKFLSYILTVASLSVSLIGLFGLYKLIFLIT